MTLRRCYPSDLTDEEWALLEPLIPAPKPGEEEGDLAMELADLLFVLISLANREGIDLEEAFLKAMEKYRKRDSARWTPKELE